MAMAAAGLARVNTLRPRHLQLSTGLVLVMPVRWQFRSALLLLFTAALMAGEASGWFFLRAPAEAALNYRLGREVCITPPFRLHFGNEIRIELGGLWIAAPTDFALPHLVNARDATLSLRYRDMFALARGSAPLHLTTLDINHLDAQLIRLADGRASWQFTAQPERPPPTVERLLLRQGEIVLRDPFLAADMRIRVDTAEADASSRTEAGTMAEFAGTFRARPLQASVTLPGGLPPALPDNAATPVAASGRIDYGGLHLDFSGSFAATDKLQVVVTAHGPSLSVLGRLLDTTLPTTMPFRLQARLVRESPVWQIAVIRARVGNSDLAGDFVYDPRPSPPRLDGNLHGRNFVLADLAPAFGTRDVDGGIIHPARGRTLPDRRLDLPSLTRMDAHIAVSLDRVDLGTAFNQPIAPLRAKLGLAAGRLSLTEIDARTAHGRLNGTMSIDASQARAQWRADLGGDDIRLDTWLKAATPQADDVRRHASANSPPLWFTGALHGRSQFVGEGHSLAEFLASLNGRTSIFVRDGTLSHLTLEALGLDLAQGLGLLLGGDDRQPVTCAVLDLEARQGRIVARNALVATPVTVVIIDGSLNFAEESLDLRFIAKPQNVSPLTLRSPIHVRGTFAAPKLAPEVSPIAARAAGALGLFLINPLAAILPFLDPGERIPEACVAALAASGQR